MFNIDQSFIVNHHLKLENVGNPLLKWLYHEKMLVCGYLIGNDFPPSWIGEKEKKLLISRGRLWLAFMKKIKTPTSFKPFKPLKLFKLSEQYFYNKGKGGVDKATENEAQIRPHFKTLFESKYIIRKINAIVNNTWKAYQAINIQHVMTMLTTVERIQKSCTC